MILGVMALCILVLPANAQTSKFDTEKGTVFKDCETCPEMIVVPKGLYIMGFGGKNHHGPPNRVIIERAFAIGRFEIKFNEWFACVLEDGCRHKPDDHKWGMIGRPVINVTWAQAKNYTR